MPSIIRSHIAYPERPKPAPVLSRREILAGNLNAKPWTDAENALMRKCYRRGEAHNLAARFGRSVKAVRLQAMKLNLTTKQTSCEGT